MDPSLARELRDAALSGQMEDFSDPIVTLSCEELKTVLGGADTTPGTKKNTSTGVTSADGTCVCCN